MKYYNAYGEDRTPFNSSLSFLERIERRWEDSDTAKIEGDTVRYFRVLETIYRNTHPFFTKEEQEEVEEKIIEIEDLLARKSVGGSSGRKLAEEDLWVGENTCDKLRMLLVKLLFKYKITYYSVEKKTWQEELEDDFR